LPSKRRKVPRISSVPLRAEPAGQPPDGQAWTVRLTIPARAEYITLCRLALTGISRLRPLTEDVLADLKLALTEAASNAVRHAYGDAGGVVQVVYELHADRLAIEVLDQGEGFDPGERVLGGEPGSLSEGGLGIAIIRAIADELEIGPQSDGKGSRLRFIKTLT
jgi:serine/threonine-protein kinase RsbW